MQIYKIIRSCIIQVRIIYCFLRETTRIIPLTSDIRHQPSAISPHPSAIVHATDLSSGISNPLVLPSVNLCECKKFFELLYPLRLQLPSIQRFTIRLQPVEHIMLFYSMLRRIPMLTFNELFDLIVPSQPTCILIHLTSYILLLTYTEQQSPSSPQSAKELQDEQHGGSDNPDNTHAPRHRRSVAASVPSPPDWMPLAPA